MAPTRRLSTACALGALTAAFLSSGCYPVITKKAHLTGEIRKRPAGDLWGPEDITVDADQGLAYISSCDRLDDDRPPGAIFVMDLKSEAVTRMTFAPSPLSRGGFVPETFRPHGLSLNRQTNPPRLFVVSHRGPDGPHVVEIFEILGQTLRHVQTAPDPERIGARLPTDLNDVAAVGYDSFYATEPSLMGTSRVVYYPGGKRAQLRPATGRLPFPNGITVSPDGRRVYVTTSLGGGTVRVYRRSAAADLEEIQCVRVGTALDNIEWASERTLLIGAHPSAWKMMRHIDRGTQSPSQIIRLHLDEEGRIDALKVEEIFADDGRNVSGSSVAARYGHKILIGSVNGNRVSVFEVAEEDH